MIDVFERLSVEDHQIFSSLLKEKSYKKGDILIVEGTVANKMYFIKSGACRSYLIKNGEDITDFFFFEQSFATDFASYCGDVPSRLNLICMEDTSVEIIYKVELEKLYKTRLAFSEIGRLMAEYSFIQIEERMRLLHTESLEDKYIWMMTKFPFVFQRVPQYHIASFLGVKPQSLSRIRAKISGKIY